MKSYKLLTIIAIGLLPSVSIISCKNKSSTKCVQLEKANKQLASNLKL